EGAVEVGGAVVLDPAEDRGLARVWVDLSRRRDTGRLLLGQLLPAELEDLVGDLGAVRRALQPAQLGRRERGRARGDNLVEQGGHLGGRLDLDLLPAP